MPDLGQQLVDYMYETMKVDDEWAVREPSGFTWWPGKLKQRVWVEDPFEDEDMQIWRVHARTDFIKGFGDTPEEREAVMLRAGWCTIAGCARDPDDPNRVQLASSMYFHEQTADQVARQMAMFAPVQAVEAYGYCGDVARQFSGWSVDESSHPTSGAREELDELLQVGSLIASFGSAPSAFEGRELIRAAQELPQPPHMVPWAHEDFLWSNLPFPEVNLLLAVRTSASHPFFGHGASFELVVGAVTADSLPCDALAFNELELRAITRSHFLGTWTGGFPFRSYQTFLPNYFHVPGCIDQTLMSQTMRGLWMANDLVGYDIAENYEEALARAVAMRREMDKRVRQGQIEDAPRPSRRGLFARLFGRRK